MDVSIIIVNYKTPNLVIDCLKSIKDFTYNINYEAIVIDNDSGDGSLNKIAEAHPWARYIQSESNLGFGRANNLGAKHASGKYLFFLNSDTQLMNNAVKILHNFMEENQNKVGACGANLYHADGSPNFSYTLYLPSLFSHVLYRSYLIKYYSNDNFNHSSINKKVAQVIGAHLMMTRTLFEEIGGFDSKYFMYVEDTDIQTTITRMGYEVYSVPEAKILHLQGASSLSYMKLKWEIDSYRIYFKKFHGKNTLKVYNGIELTSLYFRKFMYKLKGREAYRIAVEEMISKF